MTFKKNKYKIENLINWHYFYFIQCEAWVKYCNQSHDKVDFKGPSDKDYEPMVSIKVTKCSIQLGWILARDGSAKNSMGSRREAKKCDFFHLAFADGRMDVCMDGWMDGCYRFLVHDFFHTVAPIEMKLKTYH